MINQGEADETVLATMGEGAFFGDMALLLERPRGATIIAKEPTDCFVLHRADFKRLTEENSAVLWALAEIIAERLEKADAALAAMQH